MQPLTLLVAHSASGGGTLLGGFEERNPLWHRTCELEHPSVLTSLASPFARRSSHSEAAMTTNRDPEAVRECNCADVCTCQEMLSKTGAGMNSATCDELTQ